MNPIVRLLSVMALAIVVASCVTSRSEFAPQGGPPTVGMPAELSERERSFIPILENELSSRGYLPVRYGVGDMQLEFEIAEGPINIDTTIDLYEGRRLLASGQGRGTGAPLVGRANVAQTSFDRAFGEFQASLPGSTAGPYAGRDSAPASDDPDYGY